MLRWIRERLSREDGVSLVETLVAMLIVGFVLMATAATTTTALAAMQRNERQTRATQLGNERAEILQSLPFDELTFYEGDFATPPAWPVVFEPGARPADAESPLPVETVETPGAEGVLDYTFTTTLEWVDDPSDGTRATGDDGEDYKRFAVQVQWDGRGGQTVTQRFDGQRAPKLDGPTPTIPFEITSRHISPEPIILDPLGTGVPVDNGGHVDVTVTTSLPAQGVQLSYQSESGSPTTVDMVKAADDVTFTFRITQAWTPGYWTFSYVATPVAGPSVDASEQVWVSQNEEQFVSVRDFTKSPVGNIRKDTFNAANANYHKTCSAHTFSWTVQLSTGSTLANTRLQVFTLGSDATDPADDVLVASVPPGSQEAVTGGIRYSYILPAGTTLSINALKFRAFAQNSSGDKDFVDLPTVSTFGTGKC